MFRHHLYAENHNDPKNDPLTTTEIEHLMHKEEGNYYSWCGICVEEEICPKCKAQEPAVSTCLECETSGRKI